MVFATVFAILVGVAIACWWAIAILAGGVPGTGVATEAGGRGRTEMRSTGSQN